MEVVGTKILSVNLAAETSIRCGRENGQEKFKDFNDDFFILVQHSLCDQHGLARSYGRGFSSGWSPNCPYNPLHIFNLYPSTKKMVKEIIFIRI